MFKNFCFVMLIAIFSNNYVKAQTNTWLNYISQTDSSAIILPGGNGFFVDSFGSCYTGFDYYGTVKMDNISVKASSSLKSYSDFAIFKISNEGKAIWAQKSTNLKATTLTGIASDGKNGLMGIGITKDNPLTIGGKSINTNPNGALFVVNYDSSGHLLNLRDLAESKTQRSLLLSGEQILADKNKNIYLFSNFNGTVQFDTIVKSADSTSFAICFAKYDSLGRIISLNTDLSSTSSFSEAIAPDSKGNIYVSGQFYGDLYYKGKDIFSNLGISGGTDAFIAKYNSAGQLLWVGHITGPADESANGLTVDASGNVYVVGTYSGEMKIGSSTLSDATYGNYICKFNQNGDFAWLKGIKTKGEGKFQYPSICFSGNSLIVGCQFDHNLIINMDTITYNGTENDSLYLSNSAIIKYDTSGNASSYLEIKSNKSSMLQYLSSYMGNIYGIGSYISDVDINDKTVSTPEDFNEFVFKASDAFTSITESNTASQSLKIYPNPTTGNVYFSPDMDGTAEVFDMIGRKVLTTSVKQNETNTLNFNGLNTGIYILSFNTNNGYYCKKIIKR